jgi:flavin-dependent dehydrogenase
MSGEIKIIGGGLAGLSLGLALRRAGIPVTLHEAGTYPRHRVCGEFITGLAPSTIKRLGLQPMLADALRHREVAWFLNDQSARIQRLPSPALGLSRYRLDARIADAFVAAGGVLHVNSRVTDLHPAPSRVFATGRRRAPSPWLGLKVHVRALRLERELELHLGTDAYVGLAQVEEGAVNVCGLFRRLPIRHRGSNLLLAYLRASGLNELAARLDQAQIEEATFSAVAALAFDRRVTPANRVCLGDTCAMIPPFTGNGMAMAFQSAELALDPLIAFARGELAWTAACRTIHAALRGQFRLRLASASALHPFLLRPRPQRWLAALNRVRLIPFTPLYATLH